MMSRSQSEEGIPDRGEDGQRRGWTETDGCSGTGHLGWMSRATVSFFPLSIFQMNPAPVLQHFLLLQLHFCSSKTKLVSVIFQLLTTCVYLFQSCLLP